MSAKGMIFSVFFSLCSGCFSSGNPNTADMPDSVNSCLGDKHEEFVSCHGAGYLPYYTVDPIPPLDAVLNNVKGYVVMEFLVDEKGVPKKIKVVESHPDGVFDRAAIDALSQFRYEAPVVNDQPQAVRGVLYKIEFNDQDGRSRSSGSGVRGQSNNSSEFGVRVTIQEFGVRVTIGEFGVRVTIQGVREEGAAVGIAGEFGVRVTIQGVQSSLSLGRAGLVFCLCRAKGKT